jgi:Tfp pilus assembly protein PilO
MELIILVVVVIIAVSVILGISRFLSERKHNRKEARLKDTLASQTEIGARGLESLKREVEQLKKENENLRITNQALRQKPGRPELRLLHLYDAAIGKMMAKVPAFALSW